MPLCANCKHEQYFHAPSQTQCQVQLVKWESDWYEVEIAPGLKAMTQDVEYGGQCPCPFFTTTTIDGKNEVKDTPISSLDSFLPK